MKGFTVDNLDDGSRCVTRNGTYGVSAMTVEDPVDGKVKLTFVSKTLHRRLNSGVVIGAKDMDRLASQWLAKRGRTVAKALSVHIQLNSMEDKAKSIIRLVNETRQLTDG